MASDLVPMSLSPNLILPEDMRPKLSQVSTLASIPIIDLNEDQHGHGNIVQKISQACEEYGFFQVINHGIPEELCTRMINTVTEFFNLPPEEKAQFFSTDPTKQVRLFNYHLKVKDQEKIKMWSEIFYHPWHPHDNFSHLLPKNPPQYGLISQGLGLEEDCIRKKLGDNPRLRAQGNYYPPCPEPELTLGLAVHTDPNALTVVLQSEGVTGLQVIKDGKWVSVDPVPNAFVINLGDQIQVLSNGRYQSVHHRAVTNKEKLRVSVAMFYGPNKETWIGPIEELIDEEHPPEYRRYRLAEFLEEFMRQEGTRRMVKEAFEIQNQGKPVN